MDSLTEFMIQFAANAAVLALSGLSRFLKIRL